MDYFFFALFILNAAVALLTLGGLLRVAFGRARFNSGFAAIFNLALFATCTTLAFWAGHQAFPA